MILIQAVAAFFIISRLYPHKLTRDIVTVALGPTEPRAEAGARRRMPIAKAEAISQSDPSDHLLKSTKTTRCV